MSAALESALRALSRMKGDSDVTTEDLKKVLDAAFGEQLDERAAVDDRSRQSRQH